MREARRSFGSLGSRYGGSVPAFFALAGLCAIARRAAHGVRELLELRAQHADPRARGVVFRLLARALPGIARAVGVGKTLFQCGDGGGDDHALTAAISARSCMSLAAARRCFSRIASP